MTTILDRPNRRQRPGRVAGLGVVSIAMLLAACSAGPTVSPSPSSQGRYPGWPGSGAIVGTGDLVPYLVNADLAVDTVRLMVDLQDAAGRSISAAEVTAEFDLYDLAFSTQTAAATATGTFRWLIPDARAVYTVPTAFSHAGDWGVEVTAHLGGQPDRSARVVFSVREVSQTPAIGSQAPPSDTLTATDAAGLVAISTDQHPDPTFYALSVRDAISAGKPFVLVFATPAYCTSGTCGPALDQVKLVASAYAGRVNFIHVEPYLLKVADGRTQPDVDVLGHPQPIRAVLDWGLPTEPFIFVVDASGRIAAKFEGMAYPDELRAVLDALLP